MKSTSAPARREQAEECRHQHRTELVTLVFTDIVGSTALKQQLGDRAGAVAFEQHHRLVREILAQFTQCQELETAGDSFLFIFATPSDAVHFALRLQSGLKKLNEISGVALLDRIGIHVGEVVIKDAGTGAKPADHYGIQIDICARVMSLGHAGQVLMTRGVFDSARQVLKGEDIESVGPLEWLNHGPYLLKGLDEPVEICEVGEVGIGPLQAPAGSEKAQRQVSADTEPVLGWRPAIGQVVPATKWALERKLGEGGFGEVWLGRHATTKQRRVFKFCFRADRVRSLKREMTLFRVLKERIGDHPHIVRLLEVYFDAPPFYVVMDHVEGQDLKAWCVQQGGVSQVPLATRLEIVAQIADALQAAHACGVIHRDIKPGNILVSNAQSANLNSQSILAKLTDFGIGQVVSEEVLAGMTKTGFTETIVADSSSSKSGTLLYLAPELLAGKAASTHSDLYSVGVVLYQLLIGDFTRPVTTDWQDEIADPLLREDLKHCFAGHPEDRFATAGDLAKNLRSLEQRRLVLTQQQTVFQKRQQTARAGALGGFRGSGGGRSGAGGDRGAVLSARRQSPFD